MKSIPIGIQDFKVVRDDERYYFVDKSMLIGQMLDQAPNGVFLYTRPRRFGKSLNLSMIDAFLNVKYEGNRWFDGLEISGHSEYDRYKNRFPVISVDLKMGEVGDFETFVETFNMTLMSVFRNFSYLQDSTVLSDSEKSLLEKLYIGEKSVTESKYALSTLSAMLEKHHRSKVVVLIDEYDGAVNSMTDSKLRREIISFIRGMLSPLLKGNPSLQMAVVTGILQITKENIFSGLNNLFVNNILEKDYDEMFGFTDAEVKQICADYGQPEKFAEAKDWYDGYRFGNADIYNPWSILNYVQRRFEPAPYWVNTSGNSLIKDLLDGADEDVIDDLKVLGSGGSISRDVKATLTFDELAEDPSAIYSMMVLSGYLKATPDDSGYVLSIPNKELYSVFAQMITESVLRSSETRVKFRRFCKAVETDDVGSMEKSLYELMADTISSRVLDNEHSYQAFIAGMLMTLSGKYKVKADFESGEGFYDILLESRSGKGSNVVMEIKRSKSENDCESDARNALKQIKDNDYAHGLEGKTVLYGISFFKKTPYIVSEIL